MQIDDIRYLFDYDRWAMRRILTALGALTDNAWPAGAPIGGRGLPDVLVHALGAHQRWRNGLAGTGLMPRPEREPVPDVDGLVSAWEAEWSALDAWLATLDDAFLARTDEGIPFWQMLAHVVNHGTQHRSEAAALLTALGRSPGDLDMIFFAQERAGTADRP
jgi:uncharacterized damage-inducible protein DinB